MLWLTGSDARAESPIPAEGWIVEQWTSEDGLPVDHAMDVVQTPDGMIWIATVGGLVRFDGARFVTMGVEELPGMTTNRQIDLVVHPDDGALWILHDHGQGVSRLLGDTFETWDPRSGQIGATLCFSSDVEGVWLATDVGLFQLTDHPERRFTSLINGRVIGNLLTGDGTRWIGMDSAVVRVFPDGRVERLEAEAGVDGHFSLLLYGPDGMPNLLRDSYGEPLTWDGSRFREGLLTPEQNMGQQLLAQTTAPISGLAGPWGLSAHGVHHDGKHVVAFDGRVTAALPTADDTLWLTTMSAGLLRIRPSTIQVVRSGLADEQVSSVFVDSSGRLWLRGLDGWWTPGREGIEWLVQEQEQSHEPLSGGYLFEDGESLVLARSGVYRLRTDERGERSLERVSTQNFEHGMSSHRAPDGRRWLGDRAGLFVREDGIWSEQLSPDGESIEEVRAILDHPDGGLLLASAGRGLLWLDASGALRRLDRSSGVLSNNIRHLRLESGWLWISTEDAGLCVVPVDAIASQPWRCIGSTTGLPAPGAHMSAMDERGRVWVSTNRGIAVVDHTVLEAFARGERNEVHFLVLDTDDGMASAEANGGNDQAFALDHDGRIWFATQRGAAGIALDRFSLPEVPTVRLGGVSLGDVRVSGEALRLQPQHPPLRLRLMIPTSIWADQIVFRTRVNGGDWSGPETSDEVVLSSLPAGRFQIEVQAGVAGVWGPSATLSGVRVPRLSERRAFPLVLVLLGAVLTGGAAWLRERVRRLREQELEAEVAARTAELADAARILQAQKETLRSQATQLEQLDELRTRMIVNLHHELRTPISLIVGPLDELLESPDEESARRCGELALRNAEVLEKLIDQIFDIVRLETGELPIRARWIDLSALVRRVLSRMEYLAQQRGIELSGPDAAPVPIWCDPELIDKVLSNLIHNALKFSPSGAVSVTVSDTGEHVRVWVHDDGRGIPEADRERIFERLFQSDRGDARKQGGAGLGLALARELVELHGGRIGVEARAEGGSAFWFTLPVDEAPHSLEEVDQSSEPDGLSLSQSVPTSMGDGPLVLIVEDHPDMRAFLAAQLSTIARILTAADGARALELARSERPALVVSDVMMPTMTGLQLAEALRGDASLASIPILLVSAKSAVADRVSGLAVADDYLVKPFRIAELRARVQRLLQHTPTAPAGVMEPPLADVDRKLMLRLESLADSRLSDPEFGVGALARAAGMSERTLRRETSRLLSMSPASWLRERRLLAAQRLLAVGTYRTVGEVAAAVGLSRSYFSRAYTAWAGHPPSSPGAS